MAKKKIENEKSNRKQKTNAWSPMESETELFTHEQANLSPLERAS